MRYYEYKEPYYGLIKATTITRANELYEEIIADSPETPSEINEREALAKHIDGFVEGPKISTTSLIDEFYEGSEGVLLVDGGLL